MRVVFLQDVANVAQAGDIKEVASGYARNYLFPKKLAAVAAPEQLKRIEAIKKSAQARRLKEREETKSLGERLQATLLVIPAKVSEGGKLYGSVTQGVIAQELSKVAGREIGKESIELQGPIKEVGEYEVGVRLTPEVHPVIRVAVRAEDAEGEALPPEAAIKADQEEAASRKSEG